MKEAKLRKKPTWSYVCEHFGLDTNFRYSDSQRAEYYQLLSEEAVAQDPATIGRTPEESVDVDPVAAKSDEISVCQRQHQLELTPSQVAILETYAHGDYAHLVDCLSEEAFHAELDQCGDTLFRFLMSETSKREDCMSHAETIKRIDNAIRDLTIVRGAANMGPEWSFEEADCEAARDSGRDLNAGRPPEMRLWVALVEHETVPGTRSVLLARTGEPDATEILSRFGDVASADELKLVGVFDLSHVLTVDQGSRDALDHYVRSVARVAEVKPGAATPVAASIFDTMVPWGINRSPIGPSI